MGRRGTEEPPDSGAETGGAELSPDQRNALELARAKLRLKTRDILGEKAVRRRGPRAVKASKTVAARPSYEILTVNPKQAFARTLNHVRELLMSGTGGTGKSEGMLILALDYVEDPEYNALILMRRMTDLKKSDALQDRMKLWFSGTNAVWDGDSKKWRFPSGATIEIGYLSNSDDAYNYKTSQYHFIGIDELTMIEMFAYTYLFFRLRRREGCTIPLRMRSATNPDGPHADWVQQMFVPKAYLDCDTYEERFEPGVWTKRGRDAKGKEIERTMLAFGKKDNPHLDFAEYEDSLARLDDVTYRMVAEGEWGVRRGAIFRRQWFEPTVERHVVPWAHLRLCRSWDLAHTNAEDAHDRKQGIPDWTVGTLYGLDERTNQRYVLDVRQVQGDPGEVDELIMKTAREDGPRIPIVMEQEPASGIRTIAQFRRDLPDHKLHAYVPKGKKEERAQPVALLASTGRISIVTAPWNEAWLQFFSAFPKGKKDHVDSVSQAEAFFSEGDHLPFGVAWSPEHHLLRTSEMVRFCGPESRGIDTWRGGTPCWRPGTRWSVMRFIYIDEIGKLDGAALYVARPPEGQRYRLHDSIFVFRLVTLPHRFSPRDCLAALRKHELLFDDKIAGTYLPPFAEKLQEAYAMLHGASAGLWDADERFGIAPLKEGLRVDLKLPHPFVGEMMGRPRVYFVVDVDGKGRPKANDSGMLSLLQGLEQFYVEEKGGQREAIEYPALQCLRAAASVYFGPSESKTEDEMIEDLMPEGLKATDPFPTEEGALEGHLIARQVFRAQAEREHGESDDGSIFWGRERIVSV